MVVEVNNITKRYGELTALDNFSLSVQKGEVVGIVGPNGAGKTTFFNVLLSITKPTSGTFKVFGKDSVSEVRDKIGVSLEDYGFYPFLSGWDNLKIAANIKGADKAAMDRVIKLVDLDGKRDVQVKKYSFGMVKRLSIACALLNDPELLILDEPTNGLDPVGIRQMGNLIKEQAGMGKTVVIANHLLGEIEKVCDRIVMLKEGKIIKSVDKEAIGINNCFELYSDNVTQLIAALDKFPGYLVLDSNVDNVVIQSDSEGGITNLISDLNAQGIKISGSKERKVTLEDIFHSTVKESK
ncbi:hypothetical protein GCM10009122_48020 [Fulvivirga kasyanovii]|uniref:ABC transporter ATP-binding protein n=1 Tax=Fulvivirga kasyanovii TaxID=396812 RepID=UPI0031D94BD8